MSMRHNWMIRQEQRRAELANGRALTPTEIDQANRRAAAPDLGRAADVIDLYSWAREKGRDGNLADTRTYVGLTHMNIASRGMGYNEQAKLAPALRRAS